MLAQFERLMSSPGALVARDFVGAVDQAHEPVVGNERERAPGVESGYRIPIGVEPHEGRLVDGDGADRVGLRERLR